MPPRRPWQNIALEVAQRLDVAVGVHEHAVDEVGPGQVQRLLRERLRAVLEQVLRLVAQQRFDVGGVGLDGHGVASQVSLARSVL